MFAMVSVEPSGVRFACKYEKKQQTKALRALENMGGGVTLLRVADVQNYDGYDEWEYIEGVGWVS